MQFIAEAGVKMADDGYLVLATKRGHGLE